MSHFLPTETSPSNQPYPDFTNVYDDEDDKSADTLCTGGGQMPAPALIDPTLTDPAAWAVFGKDNCRVNFNNGMICGGEYHKCTRKKHNQTDDENRHEPVAAPTWLLRSNSNVPDGIAIKAMPIAEFEAKRELVATAKKAERQSNHWIG